jgi:hypothetical protein
MNTLIKEPIIAEQENRKIKSVAIDFICSVLKA